MNVGSLFSGIGGFDLGLERAGHRILWQCESDPYRRRVLARHWPGVPCYEDVARLGTDPDGPRGMGCLTGCGGTGLPDDVDLICGGFPCQDLSVAGRRRGLAGKRSGLFFEFARVADAVLPDGGWVLIENVPGLLSSHGGRDFAVLLATLAELGFHDLAWRVLDSRYLGVPQRRRRVFILARRAGGRRASEVLLEPESGGGDFTKGREAREAVADGVSSGAYDARGGQPSVSPTLDRRAADGPRRNQGGILVSHAVTTHQAKGGDPTTDNYLVSSPADPNGVRAPSGVPRRMDGARFVSENQRAETRLTDYARQLTGGGGKPGQGYPAILGTGEDADRSAFDPKPDSSRYAACGDAVTVNVAYWIGCRLKERAGGGGV